MTRRVVTKTETPESEVLGKDEAFGKIVIELLKTKERRVLSDIVDEEIKILTGLDIVAEKLDSELLRGVEDTFLDLRVSRNRIGRQELMTIALASRMETMGPRKASVDKLFAGLK